MKSQERDTILREIYYAPSGYYQSAQKFHEAVKKQGYDYDITDVRDFLHRQAVWQIHAPRPKYIPYSSFNNITIPNECHQADILYMPYDKIGRVTYLFCLNVVDVASRYKASIPIGATSVKNRGGILTSRTISKAFEHIYDDPDCPLVWPKLLITDKGSEFKGECERLMKRHGVEIQKATSKRSVAIVERYNLTLAKRLFRLQNAHDLSLQMLFHTQRAGESHVWVKNLPIIVKDINNSVTRLIGMTPAKAIKKKKVYAKSASKYNRPIGYDEPRLSYRDSVRYLLEPGEFEGGSKRRGTDMNWSPEVYIIEEALIQKNKPVLYKLLNGPERRFIREELLLVNDGVDLPPA